MLRPVSASLLLALLLAGCLDGVDNRFAEGKPLPSVAYSTAGDFDQGLEEAYIGRTFTILGVWHYTRHCMIPEGCGPPHRLLALDLGRWIPLAGEANPVHQDDIVFVEGFMERFPKEEQERHDMNYAGPGMRLHVTNVTTAGSLDYHGALIEISSERVIDRFGCLFSHDKSFRVAIEDSHMHWAVKWTEFDMGTQRTIRDRYYELWVHPDTGEPTREWDTFAESPPACWEP